MKINSINTQIKELLEIEFRQLYLLLPFVFAGGILLYFNYQKFSFIILISIIAILIILWLLKKILITENSYDTNKNISIIFKENTKEFYCECINYLMIIFIFLLFGFIIAYFRNYNTNIDRVNFFTKNINIEGKIDDIRLMKNTEYIILNNIYGRNKIEGKIKLKIKNQSILNELQNEKNFHIGCNMSVLVNLYAANIKKNKTNNRKNFNNTNNHISHFTINEKQRINYNNYIKFNKIIANGEIVKVNSINCNINNVFTILQSKTDMFRRNVQNKISNVSNNSSGGGIIISLLTGNNSFIDKNDLDAIRKSGCAHILAISGLHMAIIGAFFTIIIRKFLALFPFIVLRYNTKKIAIIISSFICFIYLQIANVPISALRSFIMLLIALIALLIDRKKSSINILVFTFFIMLLFNPEFIFFPSFQMSFIAVLSLISVYNVNSKFRLIKATEKQKGFLGYFFSIISSSFAATFATSFYEIYNFNQYAVIGIISNIFVIPLTEFIALPLGFIGLLFNNNIIGTMLYKVSSFVGEIICVITNLCIKIPYAYILIEKNEMSGKTIVLISIILTTFFIMRTKLKFIISFVCFLLMLI